jgi:AcrR family transcriptional regulator
MSLREQKKLRAREDILAAARGLIAEAGPEAARMRDVAGRAGVSYQTLYNYFPTKSRLLQALLLSDMTALLGQINGLLEAYSGDILGTLAQVNGLCLEAVDGDRDLWRTATQDLLTDDASALGFFSLVKGDSQGSLELLLARAQEFGELDRRAPVTVLADTLFSLTDYMFLRYLIDATMRFDGALAHLSAQIELVLTPFLGWRQGSE